MESISRMSNLLESARELTLDAAQSARSSRSFSKLVPPSQIKKLLDSRNDREILDGLRKVISMMYRSQPCLTFFSSVVKNVASPNIEIKKLVYIYLLSHAEQDQSLALLSINTIQKSLSDSNPQVRTLALKTMSGIRVPAISRIVSLAIKKGLGDMSHFVRKAAALAIPKCYRLDPNTLPELIGYLTCLLGDNQCSIAGAAVKALMEVCPDRIDLIHKHYRSLVRSLVDMDEWSQLATLRLMTVYSRKCFPRLTRKTARKSNKILEFLGDDYNKHGQDKSENERLEAQELIPDHELLLKSIKPLLHSRNSAVIVAVTSCYVNIGTQEYIDASIGPLVALLRCPQDIQTIALYNIVSVCIMRPEPFVKYLSHFLIHTTDPSQIWEQKLELLSLIFPHCNAHLKNFILNEFEHFSQRYSDCDLVRKAVQAIGRCAQSDKKTSLRCMRILLRHITSLDENLVEESLTVLRYLIQQDPSSHTKTIIWLAKNLDTISTSTARASIIWLVGESLGIDDGNGIAADVLRILAKSFVDEAETAKLQIILLAAKVYLHYLNRKRLNQLKNKSEDELLVSNLPAANCEDLGDLNKNHSSGLDSEHPIVALWNYIILLARFDTSYDLRDRARLCKALLNDPSTTDLASLVLLAPKPVPKIPSPSENRNGFILGSASLVVCEDGNLHGIRGYEPLPDWVLPGDEPDPSLRDVQVVNPDYAPAGERLHSAVRDSRYIYPSRSNGFGSVGYDKTLDGWLAEGEDKIESAENNDSEEDEESEEEDDCAEEDESEEEVDSNEETDSDEEDKSEASSSQLLKNERKNDHQS